MYLNILFYMYFNIFICFVCIQCLFLLARELLTGKASVISLSLSSTVCYIRNEYSECVLQ